jgi:hypothetical protein
MAFPQFGTKKEISYVGKNKSGEVNHNQNKKSNHPLNISKTKIKI